MVTLSGPFGLNLLEGIRIYGWLHPENTKVLYAPDYRVWRGHIMPLVNTGLTEYLDVSDYFEVSIGDEVAIGFEKSDHDYCVPDYYKINVEASIWTK